MEATALRAASVSLAVCAALALSACHSTGSGGSAASAPSSGTAAPAPSSGSAAPAPAGSSAAVQASGSSCRNLVVTAGVKAEVTRAYAA
ncbi:hypothetical protein GXW83_15255 [Streptacidiphilus sp. PB12-B1b]|uniref:hypothetical protein n=1 Tax=Streptacidiphilus sp. PB12-B1b TaxID=2705012 RepID=UPI0015FA708D|nr:hypothetical protein [Streptacidiphilus sp. PB12-B1b]QMU76886.1 hypothetical protein GXW83_15255 [Streptacidiphilus sp. PB12-B1b]